MKKWFEMTLVLWLMLLCSSTVLADCDADEHSVPKSGAIVSMADAPEPEHTHHQGSRDTSQHHAGTSPTDHHQDCDHQYCQCVGDHCATTAVALNLYQALMHIDKPTTLLTFRQPSPRPSNEQPYIRPPIDIL